MKFTDTQITLAADSKVLAEGSGLAKGYTTPSAIIQVGTPDNPIVADEAARKDVESYAPALLAGQIVEQTDAPETLWLYFGGDITLNASWRALPRYDENGNILAGGVAVRPLTLVAAATDIPAENEVVNVVGRLVVGDGALTAAVLLNPVILEAPGTAYELPLPANGTYDGQKVVYHIKPSAAVDLTLAAGILTASDSGTIFPKTLDQDKLYIVQLIWGANGWMLATLVGGY